jgi:hypothetical protein
MTPTNRRRPADPDVFRHTATAQANRRRKAEALVRAAVWLGSTDLEDLDDDDQRHAILVHAHAADPTIPARASEETWVMARQIRAETRVHRLPIGEDPADVVRCGCLMRPTTRVLYASVVYLEGEMAGGWLCPHEDYRVPPPELEAEQPSSQTAEALAGIDDGSSPDWDALIPPEWASMYRPGARP